MAVRVAKDRPDGSSLPLPRDAESRDGDDGENSVFFKYEPKVIAEQVRDKLSRVTRVIYKNILNIIQLTWIDAHRIMNSFSEPDVLNRRLFFLFIFFLKNYDKIYYDIL